MVRQERHLRTVCFKQSALTDGLFDANETAGMTPGQRDSSTMAMLPFVASDAASSWDTCLRLCSTSAEIRFAEQT